MDYQIRPIEVEGFASADGIYENSAGAWLGETDWQDDRLVVLPYADEEGDFVPAPTNWRELIVKEL
jgi:hypothetical protein